MEADAQESTEPPVQGDDTIVEDGQQEDVHAEAQLNPRDEEIEQNASDPAANEGITPGENLSESTAGDLAQTNVEGQNLQDTELPDAVSGEQPGDLAQTNVDGETLQGSEQPGAVSGEQPDAVLEADTSNEPVAESITGEEIATSTGDGVVPKASDVAEIKKSEKQVIAVAPKTKKYNILKLRNERTPTKGFLDNDCLTLMHSFGFETMRRNNLHRLGQSTLLTAAGNSVLVIDLVTLKQEFLLGIDGGGIGAITVHPSSNYFAIGERGTNPNVYIYAFPSRELIRVLSNGTERAFSDMRFSNDGKMLATVGSFPDYLLHIWDWEEEVVVLRAKAFSQEVYNVSFSPRFDGILYTSGTGHIRFWKMADTFTGLKLQGEIGKFGAIELSDIAAYQELKDGKVITGSESGNLLLWDGGLVKVEIRCKSGTCHKGMIEMVWMFGEYIVSAGEDGEIKFWDYNQIDVAEPCDDGPYCLLEPVLSCKIRPHPPDGASGLTSTSDNTEEAGVEVKIKTMHIDSSGVYKEWLVQDAAGALWRFPLPVTAESLASASASMILSSFTKVSAQRLMDMHAGALAGVVCCPHGGLAASAGQDGSLRLIDIPARRTVYHTRFAQGASCIVWVPKAVEESGTLVAVGFMDGVVRLVQQCADSWQLRHVFKPHTKAITCLCFSPDGRHLATGSLDGTLFILAWDPAYSDPAGHMAADAKGGWRPVAFVRSPAPLGCLSWSPDGLRILACVGAGGWLSGRGAGVHGEGGSGELVEFDLDKVMKHADEVDTSVSFEIDLPKRTYLLEQKVVVPEAPAKKKEAEEEDDSQSNKPEPVLPPPPGRPVTCVYATNSTFLVGYDGEETKGVVYECTFDFKYAIKELPTHTQAICFMSIWPPWHSLSDGPAYLITAARDGTVAIRPMLPRTPENVEEARAAALLSRCWRLHVHSVDTFVTGVALSHDMGSLLSCSDDGNLLLHAVHSSLHLTALEHLAAEAGARHLAAMDLQALAEAAAVELLKVAEVAAAGDITDPKHYSIEQEKLQAEEDRRLQAAELQKLSMRDRVDALRRELEELLLWNDRLPPQEQLAPEELELDPELRDILEQQAAHKVEQARKELAWISEKKALGLGKLQQAFLDPVAVPYLVVTALRTPYSVASFRTRKLTDDQRERMEALHARAPTDVASHEGAHAVAHRDPTSTGSSGPPGPSAAAASAPAGQSSGPGATGAAGGGGKGSSKADGKGGGKATGPEEGNVGGQGGAKGGVNKAEARKEQRRLREKQWEELMSRKPDDTYEDPNDVAAINLAQNKMGDYKLKTDDDYVVPEHLRIDADKKRRQMLLLEESVHTIKMAFNDRLLALRDLKQRILGNIAVDSARIAEINKELGIHGEELLLPQEGPEEWPERLWQLSDADLDAQPTAPNNTPAPPSKPAPSAAAAGSAPSAGRLGGGGGGGKGGVMGGQGVISGGPAGGSGGGEGEKVSEVEMAEERVRRVELEYEKEKKLDKLEHMIASFDQTVRNLRRERFKLDADLKMTDMSFLVLVQELKLLKDFEKRDKMLLSKLEARRDEKADMVARIAECQEKLSARKAEMDKVNPRQVVAELLQLVPESHKLHEPLLRIFKRKIKRQKKKGGKQGEEEGDEEEEEEEEEEQDLSDLDKEEEGEDEDDSCPPGCDPSLYEHVCELREKRVDQEEVVAEVSKAVEGLKKDKEALVKKEKMMEAGLKQCEAEIQSFQTFKQQRLNEIHVIVTLRMHQITSLIDGRLPPDLSHTIVVTNQGLGQLRQRIDELKEEKEELRKEQKHLRREHVTLSKSNKSKEDHLKQLEARARDVQKLKFGQEVDLELLERMSVNKTAEELRQQLRALEEANLKEMNQWKKQLDAAAEELGNATKINTDKLDRVAELTGAQQRLEKQLNSTQSRVVTEVGPSKDRIKAEREQLVSLVKLQAREMEALKTEINMLRRKGGHVYTPAPRPAQ